jgi:hypothetical protein
MAEFLIETYVSAETASADVPSIDDVARTADQLSQRGIEVRFLRERVVCAPGSINHIVVDRGDRIARSCRGNRSSVSIQGGGR